MRSSTLPLTLATLALFLSFQEQCRIQAQIVEAGSSSSRLGTDQQQQHQGPYPASSRLGRQYAANLEATQKRSLARRASSNSRTALKRRQLLSDESEPAVVVRPVRQSSSPNAAASSASDPTSDNADEDLSRGVRAAAATLSADRVTRSIGENGPRPGAPTSTSVTIPVSETEVSSRINSDTRPTPSSVSTSESSSSSSSSSSEATESTSSVPTSTSSSSSTSSRSSTQSPSVVLSTTTLSSSSESASPTGDSQEITSVWQAYNKGSKYFPIAVVVTVVIGMFIFLLALQRVQQILTIHPVLGIAILVALVAILQCIARAPRFRKDKDRPLLIPRDSTWSGSDVSGSGAGGLASDTSSRRDSISSQAAAAKRISWEKFGTSTPSRVNSNSSRLAGVDDRDMTANSSATWAKEDFLPHSGENEPTNSAYSLVDVYPALPKFARGPITPTSAAPASASNLGSPYPPFPARSPVSSMATIAPHFSQTTLPVIRKVDSSIHATPQYPQGQVQSPPMMQRLARGPSILFKPRPGPTEQQSGHRLSMSRGGLPSHVVLPPGVAERRRWERCST